MSVIGLRHYDDDDDYSDDVDDDDSVEEDDDDDDDNGEYVCFSTLNTGAQAKTTRSVQSSATMKQTAVQSCNNSEVCCVAKNASGVIIFSSAFKMIQLPNTG
ncbi:hypothetical protein DPMN_131967 [Dreissena polymorpha]|uniref:Uncharacterized protein n=1 Tax=Dreissena polymorpha TaxID=45954 RepID=A0A9D4FVW3_DREPO|nr:hypothetical protein DPMN_131967 [Dreissena polymorpha]